MGKTILALHSSTLVSQWMEGTSLRKSVFKSDRTIQLPPFTIGFVRPPQSSSSKPILSLPLARLHAVHRIIRKVLLLAPEHQPMGSSIGTSRPERSTTGFVRSPIPILVP